MDLSNTDFQITVINMIKKINENIKILTTEQKSRKKNRGNCKTSKQVTQIKAPVNKSSSRLNNRNKDLLLELLIFYNKMWDIYIRNVIWL